MFPIRRAIKTGSKYRPQIATTLLLLQSILWQPPEILQNNKPLPRKSDAMSRLTQLLLLALSASSYVLGASNKRGLIHIPSSAHPEDDRIWLMTKTNGNGMKGLPDRVNLKWYYNYQVQPSQSIPAKRTGAGQEDKPVFVPMLWGDYQNNFVEDVRRLRREGYVIE